jgi:hypothetical protein
MRRSLVCRARRPGIGRTSLLGLLCLGLLVCVGTLVVAGCDDNRDEQEEYRVRAPAGSITVGQSVNLKLVRITTWVSSKGEESGETEEDVSKYEWWVDPEEGATCEDGQFTATIPGEYVVGVKVTTQGDRSTPAYLTVVKQAATLKYDNHNSKAVHNNGAPPTFEIAEPTTVASIETYHWNNGTGSANTGKISLKAEDGTVYGPWKTEGTEGQGGVPNAYWTASPTVKLPEGSYTVVDSDPGTWSQNAGSQGKGMVRVYTVTEK